MDIRETLIAQVREVLIRENDQVGKQDLYLLFVNECQEAQLSEEDFYKLILKPAYKSIDWEAIDKAWAEGARLEALKVQQQKDHEDAVQEAPALIDRLITVAFEDGIVTAAELEVIFEKARNLSQDTSKLVIRVDTLLHERGYKSWPRANFEAPTLMAMLLSADWYDALHYPTPVQAAPPPAANKPPVVTGTPTIHHFMASRTSVKKGEQVILSWHVSGVSEIFISNLGYTTMINGSHTVSPQQSTDYKLVAGKVEQLIHIEVKKPFRLFKMLLVIVLVLATAIAVSHMINGDNDEPESPTTDMSVTEADRYKPATLDELRSGGGASGLTDAAARELRSAVTGYYQALNRQPVRYDEVSRYFAFPLDNYYGNSKPDRQSLEKSLAAYYGRIVTYVHHDLSGGSRFTGKKNGHYYLTIDETCRYRERKAPDVIVTMDVTETIVLDEQYKIISINTQRKSGRNKR